MKKTFRFIVILLLTLTLVACSSDKGPGTGELGTVGAMETFEYGDSFKASEPISIPILYRDHPNYQYKEDWLFWEKLTEMTDVELDPVIVPYSDWEERRSLLLGAGDAPYIISDTGVGQEAPFAASGAILAVSDYVEHMPHFSKRIEEWGLEDQMDSIRHLDGKYYMLPSMFEVVWPEYTLAYRADILEENNIDVPTTWDEFADVLAELKEIYPDKLVFSDRWQANSLFNFMSPQFGITGGWGYGNGMVFNHDNDEFEYMAKTDGFKQFATYFNNLVANDLMDIESFTQDDDQAVQKFETGDSFFISTNVQEMLKHRQTMDKVLDEDFEVKKMILPGGPAGNLISGMRINNGIMLSEDIVESENFLAILQFIDWLYYSDEGITFSFWGVEGETYNMVDGKVELREDISFVHLNPDAPKHLQVDFGFYNGVFVYGGGAVSQELRYTTMDDEEVAWQKLMVDTKDLQKVAPSAPLDEAQSEEAAMLATPLKDITEQNLMNFITGKRSLDDFDSFVSELEESGMGRLEEMLNEAYQKLQDALD